MLARCQFGAFDDGRCGAFLTYPIKNYPWRRNPTKGIGGQLCAEQTLVLFSEPSRILAAYPQECLRCDDLWSDSSEKANGITRDRATNTLCWTIGVMLERGEPEAYFALRENSVALTNSSLYSYIVKLIQPYEQHPQAGVA